MSPVLIRPYEATDIPLLFEAGRESRSTIGPWLPWCHENYSEGEARAFVEAQIAAFASGAEYTFAITSPGGRFLGCCGLNLIDRTNRRANLGYWVRASEVSRGVATSAVRLLGAWAFENTPLERLEIVASTENLGSQRVAEKAGAVREGIARSRLHLHGRAHDAIVYSILRTDPRTVSA